MANSHPGSYCGQDAYNDMFVTEKQDGNFFIPKVGSIQGIRGGEDSLCEGLQVGHGSDNRGGAMRTVVRRLTPLECERLQGFPDNWTLIGEPVSKPDGEVERFYTDSEGKRRKVTDSARYKALGNSICTPFWKFLARRICAQYERDITIGSLFDGIGGFPYVFENCGAKAIWASEIEEFPIAVTKERFPERQRE